MEYAIETFNLTKRAKKFSKRKILNDISIKIPKGSIYGIIGKNGAGKTTLMRALTGLIHCNSGKHLIFNSDNLTKEYKRIGVLIEKPGILDRLSAFENMEYFRKLFGIIDKNEPIKILKSVGLDYTDNTKASKLSLGMKQRLGIAIALLNSPDILILDEPTNGLDAEGVYEIRNLLIALNRDKGVTILISSHILSELTKIATHYVIIDNGSVIDAFTREELLEKNKKFIKFRVHKDDVARASYILEEELKISNFKVFPRYEFRIFEDFDISTLNFEFSKRNIRVIALEEKSKDLEEYFVDLIGGDKYD